MGAAFNDSIVFLLAVPAVMLGLLAWSWWRSARSPQSDHP